MLDDQVYSTAHYLERLTADYAARGYRVEYLPFFYSADFVPLAGGATAQQRVTIEHDADFVMVHLTSHAWEVVTDQYHNRPQITVELFLDTSQRRIQDVPFSVDNVFGVGGQPATLFKPLVLAAKSVFTVTVVNGFPALEMQLRLTFGGCKAFMYPAG